jgi:enolase
MKIDDIKLTIIKDSRQEDTLEAVMRNGPFEVVSSVPHGKSRGEREVYLADSPTALKNFEKIKPIILKQKFESLIDFDHFLLQLDGTDNKKNLGGNLTLVLSQTFARLAAKLTGLELFKYLKEELLAIAPELQNTLQKVPSPYFERSEEKGTPYFLFNLINGGQHASYFEQSEKQGSERSEGSYGPKIQEYLIVPKIDNPRVSLELAEIFFAGLKEYFLKEYGEIKFGDEGGLLIPACAGKPENNYEKPLEIFSQIREELKLEKDVGFSLDAAASSFYDKNIKEYRLFLDKSSSREELLEIYKELNKRYHLVSVEDPFEENDFENFKKITSLFGKKTIIIGDDLTVTNPKLLEKAAGQKAISGIIIKPTQIGTITETLKTMALAHQKQIKIIVSHRSAETLDDFIADLAVAGNAWGLKAGAPQPEERMVKYRRVITILSKS